MAGRGGEGRVQAGERQTKMDPTLGGTQDCHGSHDTYPHVDGLERNRFQSGF